MRSFQSALKLGIFALFCVQTSAFSAVIEIESGEFNGALTTVNWSATCFDCAGEKGVDTGYDYTEVFFELQYEDFGEGSEFVQLSYSGSDHVSAFVFNEDNFDVYDFMLFGAEPGNVDFILEGLWFNDDESLLGVYVDIWQPEDSWDIYLSSSEECSLEECEFGPFDPCPFGDCEFGEEPFDFGDFTSAVGISDPTKVPEPSTLLIFALGLTGLASRRFKKNA